MSTGESVYRFIFEDDGGGDGSPPPSARPGRAEAARQETADRPERASPRRGGPGGNGGGAGGGTGSNDKPATAGDILRILQKGFGSTPVLGRLVQVGGQIVAPLVDMVSALRDLRKILAANNALASKATSEAVGAAGRATVSGVRATTAAAGAAEAARTGGGDSRAAEYQKFADALLRARQARESRMLTLDAESRPSGTPRFPSTSLVPSDGPKNRLPVPSGAGGIPVVAGRATAVAQPVAASGAAAAGGSTLAAGAVVAGAAAAVVVALGASVVATRALTGRANELTKRLEGFSGQLAASQARAEVARLQQQIASAQKLSPALTKYNDAKSRGDIALEKIYDSFTKAGLEALQPLIDTAVKYLEIIAKHSDEIATGAATAAKVASWGIPGVGPIWALKDAISYFTKEQEKKTDDEKRQAGSFEVLMHQIPDLNLDDEATAAAGLTRQDVAFGGLGGEQMELP